MALLFYAPLYDLSPLFIFENIATHLFFLLFDVLKIFMSILFLFSFSLAHVSFDEIHGEKIINM